MADDFGTPEGLAELQLQRTKADIKNVLPLDLYIVMTQAGLLAAELESGQNVPDRRVKSFYAEFYTVFNFLHSKVSTDLQAVIRLWFGTVNPAGDRREVLACGVALFHLFYDELTDLGIGQMFEQPIEPPIEWDLEQDLMEGINEIERQFYLGKRTGEFAGGTPTA